MFVERNTSGGGVNHHRHTGIKTLGRQLVASTSDRLRSPGVLRGDLPSFYVIFKTSLRMRNTKSKKEMAVSELKVRYRPPKTDVQLLSTTDVYNFLYHIWNKELITVQEQFYVVFLSRQNHVLTWRCMNTGTNSSMMVDVKLLFSIALTCMAQIIVIAHNHPSGNLRPSMRDRQVTANIQSVCTMLDMKLLDHMIISSFGYYSFKLD